jgi:hypothetical protein
MMRQKVVPEMSCDTASVRSTRVTERTSTQRKLSNLENEYFEETAGLMRCCVPRALVDP